MCDGVRRKKSNRMEGKWRRKGRRKVNKQMKWMR